MQDAWGTVSSWGGSAAGWAGQAAGNFFSPQSRIQTQPWLSRQNQRFRLDITGDAVSDTMLSRDIYTKMISSAWKYSGAQAISSFAAEGMFSQLGRVARGIGGTSQAEYTASFMQAAQGVPLIGGAMQDFFEPYQAAQSRTTGYFSNLARGGFNTSPEQQRAFFDFALKQEHRAKEVSMGVERMVQGEYSKDDVLLRATQELTRAVDRLLVGLATGPAATWNLMANGKLK